MTTVRRNRCASRTRCRPACHRARSSPWATSRRASMASHRSPRPSHAARSPGRTNRPSRSIGSGRLRCRWCGAVWSRRVFMREGQTSMSTFDAGRHARPARQPERPTLRQRAHGGGADSGGLGVALGVGGGDGVDVGSSVGSGLGVGTGDAVGTAVGAAVAGGGVGSGVARGVVTGAGTGAGVRAAVGSVVLAGSTERLFLGIGLADGLGCTEDVSGTPPRTPSANGVGVTSPMALPPGGGRRMPEATTRAAPTSATEATPATARPTRTATARRPCWGRYGGCAAAPTSMPRSASYPAATARHVRQPEAWSVRSRGGSASACVPTQAENRAWRSFMRSPVERPPSRDRRSARPAR